jgi:hypothetical protein
MSLEILQLDDTDLFLPIFSWWYGNGKTSFNTGVLPSYLGNYQPITLVNCADGYGYVAEKDFSRLRLQNDDPDYAQSSFVISLANAGQWSFLAWVNVGNNLTNRELWGCRDGNNDWVRCRLVNSNKFQIDLKVGGNYRNTLSTDLVTVGIHLLGIDFDNGTFSLFVDAQEVDAYDSQQAYNLGSKNFTMNMRIGTYGAGVNAWSDSILSFHKKTNRLLTQSEKEAYYGLGVNFGGLIATNKGNIMNLKYPSLVQSKRFYKIHNR